MTTRKKTFLQGFIIGLIIPLIGFFLLKGLFALLTSFGLMQEVSASTSGKRFRTLTLLAICLNIFPVHRFRQDRSERFLRGIITAVFLYIIIWVIYFYSSLMI